MMDTLLALAGYLLSIASMTPLPFLAYKAVYAAFPSLPEDLALFVLSISIFLPFVLKNLLWVAVISEFPFSLPSGASEMVATLLGLADYLVCMTGLSFVVLVIATLVCQAASRPIPEKKMPPDWMVMIGLGADAVVMDMFINHSSPSGYLFYIVFTVGLPYLVFLGAMTAFSLQKDTGADSFVTLIIIFLLLALKNFSWLALISEFPYTLPSSVSEMIATFVGLAGYFVCMTGLSFLVLTVASFVSEATLGPHPKENTTDWIDMITFGITVVVMDMFVKHSGQSNIMAILLFAGYLIYIMCLMGLSYLLFHIMLLFDDTIVPALPFLLPVLLKYQRWVPMIVAGVILVLNDIHGVMPVEKPAFISEFLPTLPFSVLDTFPGYLVYILCMVTLSFLVLIIAAVAIQQARIHIQLTELMRRTIITLRVVILGKQD